MQKMLSVFTGISPAFSALFHSGGVCVCVCVNEIKN